MDGQLCVFLVSHFFSVFKDCCPFGYGVMNHCVPTLNSIVYDHAEFEYELEHHFLVYFVLYLKIKTTKRQFGPFRHTLKCNEFEIPVCSRC